MAKKIKTTEDLTRLFYPHLESAGDLMANYTEKELRSEYSRLRSIARKRIERMAATPFARRSTVFRNYRNSFVRLPDLRSTEDVAEGLVNLGYFLDRVTGSVEGYKSYLTDMQDVLSRKIGKWTEEYDTQELLDWLDYAKSLHLGNQYDSDRVLELVRNAHDAGYKDDKIRDDFERWYSEKMSAEQLLTQKKTEDRHKSRYVRKRVRPVSSIAQRRQPTGARKKNTPRRKKK